MKVNSKRTGGHHLPCLSGLSQAPLIADDGSGERSTQISAHSLSLNSPTIPTTPHHNSNLHHDDHSQPPQLSGSTPVQNSSSSMSKPAATIFFPPPPPRSLSNRSQLNFEVLNSNACSATNCTTPSLGSMRAGLNGESATANNGGMSLPKNDINMNADQERNREATRLHMSLSTNQNLTALSSPKRTQFQGPNSPGLNSPLSVPTRPFSGFFPESHNLFAQHQQQARKSASQPSAPTSVVSTPMPCSANNNDWPQQDDNYHLYHEPIDPDENSDQQIPEPSSKNHSPILRLTPLIALDGINQAPLPPRPRSNLSTSPGAKDWSVIVPNTPTEKSPTFAQKQEQLNQEQKRTPLPFADRASSFRNDVSADIYFCYVTSKLNERANHRSRSYHGPKNGAQTRQSPFIMELPLKNMSSTSVTELSMSPTATTGSTLITFQFRNNCVRELIETESNYVHALEMIVARFAKPLEPLLKKEDNQLIFGHIRYFHHIHSAFQADLVKAALRAHNKDLPKLPSPQRNSVNGNPSTPTLPSNDLIQMTNNSPLSSPKNQDVTNAQLLANDRCFNGGSIRISSCFLNAKEKFLKYGEYCATLSKAQSLLDELTNKNEAIAAQLDRSQQDANEGKFKLRDLLSLPMQRILKYHLLLAQLIKSTSPTYEDYYGLKRAHETMVDIGQYINEVKRDTEAMQIIKEIEHSIVGLNMPSSTRLIDYGRLVTDGFIRIKVPSDQRTKSTTESKLKLPHDNKLKQKRYVFVFDKVMLLCKVSGVRGHQYKEALVLSEFELDASPKVMQSETSSKHATKDKWSHNFSLTRTSDRTIYSFFSKTQEMKNKWVNAIERAMDNIRPAICRNSETNHEFLMHTFDKASSCDNCGKLLLGLYYQGYRCRICFTSVHKKCLNTRPCGPALPPKQLGTTIGAHAQRVKCNEPPSPSIRSNCSDDSHNGFTKCPPSNLSSSHCVDSLTINEYSNLNKRLDTVATSFRESGARALPINQRPVSSMVNVSSQNSTNHMSHHKRILKSSTSTPAISRRTNIRAEVVNCFDGDESIQELKLTIGDVVLIQRDITKSPKSNEDIDSSLLKLIIGSRNELSDSWWFGRNTRTGKEGRFPPEVVKVINDDIKTEDKHGSDSTMQFETKNRYVNFILDDQPWYCGRMERDQAQHLLENSPHGTFLVRVSPRHNNSYVISLNYNNQVKHMRIHVSPDNQLFLSENRYFKSIIELVSWYEKNSLVESFNMLDARLSIPFKSC